MADKDQAILIASKILEDVIQSLNITKDNVKILEQEECRIFGQNKMSEPEETAVLHRIKFPSFDYTAGGETNIDNIKNGKDSYQSQILPEKIQSSFPDVTSLTLEIMEGLIAVLPNAHSNQTCHHENTETCPKVFPSGQRVWFGSHLSNEYCQKINDKDSEKVIEIIEKDAGEIKGGDSNINQEGGERDGSRSIESEEHNPSDLKDIVTVMENKNEYESKKSISIDSNDTILSNASIQSIRPNEGSLMTLADSYYDAITSDESIKLSSPNQSFTNKRSLFDNFDLINKLKKEGLCTILAQENTDIVTQTEYQNQMMVSDENIESSSCFDQTNHVSDTVDKTSTNQVKSNDDLKPNIIETFTKEREDTSEIIINVVGTQENMSEQVIDQPKIQNETRFDLEIHSNEQIQSHLENNNEQINDSTEENKNNKHSVQSEELIQCEFVTNETKENHFGEIIIETADLKNDLGIKLNNTSDKTKYQEQEKQCSNTTIDSSMSLIGYDSGDLNHEKNSDNNNKNIQIDSERNEVMIGKNNTAPDTDHDLLDHSEKVDIKHLTTHAEINPDKTVFGQVKVLANNESTMNTEKVEKLEENNQQCPLKKPQTHSETTAILTENDEEPTVESLNAIEKDSRCYKSSSPTREQGDSYSVNSTNDLDDTVEKNDLIASPPVLESNTNSNLNASPKEFKIQQNSSDDGLEVNETHLICERPIAVVESTTIQYCDLGLSYRETEHFKMETNLKGSLTISAGGKLGLENALNRTEEYNESSAIPNEPMTEKMNDEILNKKRKQEQNNTIEKDTSKPKKQSLFRRMLHALTANFRRTKKT